MTYKQKFKILATAACSLYFAPVIAQNLYSDIEPFSRLGQAPSPQATDLGRYGEIPVSFYTGRANIVAPIRSFVENGITLDINLTYDTSGLLVNQLPGWVGPGWSINTGGVITRSQNGLCDEMTYDDRLITHKFFNYFQRHNTDLQDISTQQGIQHILENFWLNDYSPDIFCFNFLGKMGKFFLGSDGEWKVISNDNLVVKFNYNDPGNFVSPVFEQFPKNQQDHYSQPKAIRGFVIYDDEGNKYTFGYNDESVEYSMDFFHGTRLENKIPWVATSWYLTKVEDRFDNKLFEFTYHRGKFMAQLYQFNYAEHSSTPSYEVINFPSKLYSGTLTSPVYPSEIKTRSGMTIRFFFASPYGAGTAGQHLYPNLHAQDLYSQIKQNEKFYYLQDFNDSKAKQLRVLVNENINSPLTAIDYQQLQAIHVFSNSSSPLDTKCSYHLIYDSSNPIQLKELEVRTSSLINKYSFAYYGPLNTDFLTTVRDLWGYSPVPTSGMLRKISYPTGGCSILEYEKNDYSSRLSPDRQSMIAEAGTAGGLRIKSITDQDGSKILQKRSFSYNKPGTTTSSGQLFQKPITHWELHRGGNYIFVKQSIPVVPLRNSDGIIVGYSDITETLLDGTSHHYHYSNYSDVKDELPLHNLHPETISTPFDRFSEKDFMRGKLLSETIMDKNGSTIRGATYIYRHDEDEFLRSFSLTSNISPTINNNVVGCIYKIFYPKYDLEQSITTTKYENGFVTDTMKYTMNSFNHWIEEWGCNPNFRKCISEETSRKGYSVKKIHSYSYANTDRCFLPRVSSATYINGTLTQTDKVIYQTINNHFQPRHETSVYSTAVDDTLITYSSYSDQGLPLTYQRPGEFPTRLFWSSKGQLLASVTSPYDDLDCDEKVYHIEYSPAGTFTGDEYSPKDVIKKNGRSIFEYPEVRATTYIYDDLGRVHASAEANGICKFFFYDALGRITEIRNDKQQVLQKFTYKYSTGQ